MEVETHFTQAGYTLSENERGLELWCCECRLRPRRFHTEEFQDGSGHILKSAIRRVHAISGK